jgi:hypothetical protein
MRTSVETDGLTAREWQIAHSEDPIRSKDQDVRGRAAHILPRARPQGRLQLSAVKLANLPTA